MIPIETVTLLGSEYKGLKPFIMQNLRQIVVLTGPNGSGKSRLLNLLADFLKDRKSCDCDTFSIKPDNGEKFTVSDFSHYDAPLQLPSKFPYFVVARTAARLKKAEFANIDKETLLYIQCIARHYKDDFERFNILLKEIIGEPINYNAGELTFYGLKFKDMCLSPGQQYLLRLCVTLFCNETITDPSDKRVLLLDEPEMHLHPGVLFKIVSKIQITFKNTQIWIATHSISLLSIFDTTDIWYMEDGRPKQMNSNSFKVLQGLLEDAEQKTDYREKLEYFIQLPNIFSLCEFAKESLKDAVSISLKERIDGKEDPQNKLAKESINELDFGQAKKKEKIKLVDFGAGKGRFFEGLSEEETHEYDYYAYNAIDETNEEDKARCIALLSSRFREDEVQNKYFDNINVLREKLNGEADCVLLMNVLHEIEPSMWEMVLKKDIRPLLTIGGILVIIEVEELYKGENASSCGFLVLTEESSKKLFGNDVKIRKLAENSKNKQRGIIACIVGSEQLENVCLTTIIGSVELIKKEAMEKITKIRKQSHSGEDIYRKGMYHAFWLHQYANASIALDSLNRSNYGNTD